MQRDKGQHTGFGLRAGCGPTASPADPVLQLVTATYILACEAQPEA